MEVGHAPAGQSEGADADGLSHHGGPGRGMSDGTRQEDTPEEPPEVIVVEEESADEACTGNSQSP